MPHVASVVIVDSLRDFVVHDTVDGTIADDFVDTYDTVLTRARQPGLQLVKLGLVGRRVDNDQMVGALDIVADRDDLGVRKHDPWFV